METHTEALPIDPAIATETLIWEGITLSLTYKPKYFGGACTMAHLAVQAVEPADAPLPITGTGYRSHFLPAGIVEESGGPSAYVLTWLEEEATSREWQAAKQKQRQLSLF